ncbi:GL10613 [Drosophila persimilis]|uniref:GL10613 n=1 Tax=Drosophila persimilis TaxID=7234 RepID=B4GB09_DROPE|nr:GL10613 [Drosophila persimilis]
MACYYRQNEETTVTIPKYTNETSSGGVTYYDIKVRVAKVEWMVERRYRDFAQLHDKLVEDIAISKKLLPPKKLVGNKQPAFLEQRREQLEAYLQELLIYFRTELPRALAEFLDFNKYDIIYLLQDLAKLFDESGDALLSSKKEYNLSALELQKLGSNFIHFRGAKYSLGTIANRRYTNFSPELEQTLQSENNYQSIKKLSKYAAHHIKWHRGQGNSDLQYFNYLLLDPRVTNKLANRAPGMHCIDVWFTFLSAIFYVGKGKGIRPFVHFLQAEKLLGTPDSIKQAKDPKLALILSIWEQKRGIVLIRGFRGISSADAQTREASMINALGMNHLTNRRVFAISERLSLPCPPNVDRDGKYDFSHVLDFCTQLVALVVTPVKDNASYAQDYNTVDVPIGRSNIIPNRLNFNLNAFRNLKTLKFSALSTENIVDIELLKPTLQTICVHNTTIQNICQVLLCDNLHKYCDVPSLLPEAIRPPSATNGSILISTDAWQELTDLDLTGNLLTQIDGSVRTAPKLRRLVLEQNRIRVVQNLDELPHLQLLSLSGNLIAECVDWHLTMGNLVTLELAQNKLKSLKGLRKLLSLVNLDLSCNQIEDLEEVDYVANLPLLESLRLTGNPLAGSVDYRPRVLARFHERAVEISLDNERGSQQELDTALVLSALLQSKQRQRQK